jgi:threonine dehydrogenase-like Zn-dependent dehydrogenase
MKGYGMIKAGQAGWLEKEKPVVASPYDVIIKPIAVAPCSSDTHLMHSGVGEKKCDFGT